MRRDSVGGGCPFQKWRMKVLGDPASRPSPFSNAYRMRLSIGKRVVAQLEKRMSKWGCVYQLPVIGMMTLANKSRHAAKKDAKVV